jgi:hypothetical protein
MTSKSNPTFQVLDKRRIQTTDQELPELPGSAKYRRHVMLLGYLGADHARDLLERKGASADVLIQAMQHGERAETRIRSLSPMPETAAAQPIENAAALSEIQRVMSRLECKSAYPEGSWKAELVEIAAMIPIQPSLDIDYARNLDSSDLMSSNLLPAVKLCFAEKHPTEFDVSVDQRQKAVSIHGINPSLEVAGLRYECQPDGGPVLVSFMVGPAPNIVVVSRYAGRHFLSSGYHRVYHLMRAGYSHVPCAVREVTNPAQAGAYGPDVFREQVLMAPRPPLFPDFVDPELAAIVPLPARHRVVRIRPDEYFVPG